jgi:hypothetical protein
MGLVGAGSITSTRGCATGLRSCIETIEMESEFYFVCVFVHELYESNWRGSESFTKLIKCYLLRKEDETRNSSSCRPESKIFVISIPIFKSSLNCLGFFKRTFKELTKLLRFILISSTLTSRSAANGSRLIT